MKSIYYHKKNIWIQLVGMIFNKAGKIVKVTARKIGSKGYRDNVFFELKGEELNDISINIEVKHNIDDIIKANKLNKMMNSKPRRKK